MIYLLFGSDTYRSREKARELLTAFNTKHGDAQPAQVIDAEVESEAALMIGRGASLFSKKEFVLVKNVLRATEQVKKHVSASLQRWAVDTDFTVLFWEGESANGRDPFFAAIQGAAAKTQEFKLLEPAAVRAWIARDADRRKIRLSADAARALATRFGADLFRISNELDKIAAGAEIPSSVSTADRKIWDFTDAFLERPRRAFRSLCDILEQGEDPVMIGASVASAIRTLALVADAMRRKTKKDIEKLHPFVIRKYSALLTRVRSRDIRHAMCAALRTDFEMKTSRLPAAISLLRLVLDERRRV